MENTFCRRSVYGLLTVSADKSSAQFRRSFRWMYLSLSAFPFPCIKDNRCICIWNAVVLSVCNIGVHCVRSSGCFLCDGWAKPCAGLPRKGCCNLNYSLRELHISNTSNAYLPLLWFVSLVLYPAFSSKSRCFWVCWSCTELVLATSFVFCNDNDVQFHWVCDGYLGLLFTNWCDCARVCLSLLKYNGPMWLLTLI